MGHPPVPISPAHSLIVGMPQQGTWSQAQRKVASSPGRVELGRAYVSERRKARLRTSGKGRGGFLGAGAEGQGSGFPSGAGALRLGLGVHLGLEKGPHPTSSSLSPPLRPLQAPQRDPGEGPAQRPGALLAAAAGCPAASSAEAGGREQAAGGRRPGWAQAAGGAAAAGPGPAAGLAGESPSPALRPTLPCGSWGENGPESGCPGTASPCHGQGQHSTAMVVIST